MLDFFGIEDSKPIFFRAFLSCMRHVTLPLLLMAALIVLGCEDADSSPDETAQASEPADRTVPLHPKENLLKDEGDRDHRRTWRDDQTRRRKYGNERVDAQNVVVLGEEPRQKLLWRVGGAGGRGRSGERILRPSGPARWTGST
jgi:hypothetical protein